VPAEVKLEDDDQKIKAVVSGSVCESVQVLTKKSRGPGGGQTKNKEKAEQAAYRQKKVETINKLAQIQEQCHLAFEQCVNNQAHMETRPLRLNLTAVWVGPQFECFCTENDTLN
jgi:hypothetical protein